MTTPPEETTPQDPQRPAPENGPQVTTVPPPSRWRWRFGPVPSHLGRARTSTVVLAALFVGVFVLWVYVRPDPVQTVTTGGDTAVATTPSPAATRAPASTTAAPSTTARTTTTPAQSTSAGSTAATTPPATTTAGTTTAGSTTPVPATGSSAPATTTGAASTTATPTG